MPSDPDLIRSSFDLIAPPREALIDRFYDNLFRVAPQVRPLFPEDMARQKRHLLSAVALVIKHADSLEPLRGGQAEKGSRHIGYGAQPGHYSVVRDTMLQTMGEVARDAFTDDFRAACERALNAVAGMTLAGTHRAAA